MFTIPEFARALDGVSAKMTGRDVGNIKRYEIKHVPRHNPNWNVSEHSKQCKYRCKCGFEAEGAVDFREHLREEHAY